VILTIPGVFVSLALLAWLGRTLGWCNDDSCPKWIGLLVRAITVAWMTSFYWAGIHPAYARTSRFIIECTEAMVKQGKVEAAKAWVRAEERLIWYRHWKRNPWFRRFVAESGLLEVCPRLARFSRRCPA